MHQTVVQIPTRGDVPTPSWVELQPGMVVRVEGAYYREGSPRVGLTDYLGAETARYEVTPRGTLRLITLSSFTAEHPERTQPRDQPAVQTLVRPRNLSARYHRLFFQIVMSRTDSIRPAMLLGARSASELDKTSHCETTSETCTGFPPFCTASLEIAITVNGARRMVAWGTTLGAVAVRPQQVNLRRLTNGRMVPVPIDLSDPAAMRIPLLHGDELRWE